MDNVLLILLCLGLGMLLQRHKQFGPQAATVLNHTVIYISLPALTLLYIPAITFDAGLLFPAGAAWLVFGVAWLLVETAGRALRFDKPTRGCLVLTCGLGNTSFVGFPVIEALYGAEGLKTAIIADQPGSFVVLSTLGIVAASYYAKGNVPHSGILHRVIRFPPLIAFVVAVLLPLSGFTHTAITRGILEPLAGTVVPLALLSVGLQLQPRFSRHSLAALATGLCYKLILAPLLILLLYYVVLGATGLPIKVSIMEAAMGPMISAAIVASQSGLQPGLVSQITGVGIPASLLTLAGWYFLLEYLAL